jgi:hypothetical protein
MTLYSFLIHFHSIIRWFLLIGLVLSIVVAMYNFISKKQTGKAGKQIHFITATIAHVQLLLGLILYFISPKVIFNSETMKFAASRFYTMEHISMMILAIVLITIGMMRSRRAKTDGKYFYSIISYYLAALILIISAIPWPAGKFAGGWF